MNVLEGGRWHKMLPAAFAVLCATATAPSSVCAQREAESKLKPQVIRLKGKAPFSLLLPGGVTISPAAEGLKRVRFVAKAPDGRIFVTTLHDLSDNSEGAVYILDGFDE